MIILKILILIVLGAISIQDLLYRSVYWILFLVLTILFIVLNLQNTGLYEAYIFSVSINIIFFSFQLLLIFLWFSLKEKKIVKIVDSLLGLGDILFILTIAFYLSAFYFILFYIISLLITLITWFLWQTIVSSNNKQVPLAGLQAALLGMYILFDCFFPSIKITQEIWLPQFIGK